jgi:hypothetical protein
MRNLGPLGLAIGALDSMGQEQPHLFLKAGESHNAFRLPQRRQRSWSWVRSRKRTHYARVRRSVVELRAGLAVFFTHFPS